MPKNLLSFASILYLLIACNPKPATYQLVYLTDQHAPDLELYLLDLDGNQTRLYGDTTLSIYGMTPHESGDFLLFRGWEQDDANLYKLDLHSRKVTDYIRTSYNEGGADLDDSGNLVYTSNKDHEKAEMYLRKSDGTEKRITFNEGWDMAPRFSPDGQLVAYCSQVPLPDSTDHAGNGEIIVYDIEKDINTRITYREGFDCLPDWSPDGRQITFHGCEGEGCQIFVINADGTNQRQITSGNDNRWPRWSPDGKWVAYTSVRNDQTDIYLIKPDGSEEIQLTKAPGRDEVAEWIIVP